VNRACFKLIFGLAYLASVTLTFMDSSLRICMHQQVVRHGIISDYREETSEAKAKMIDQSKTRKSFHLQT